jgi:long-chain acyl-CoA synthetase
MPDSDLISEWIGSWKNQRDSIAVTDGARSLSYADLHAQVVDFAGSLRDQGVAPGDRVALVLENSSRYVVSYLAVLAAGAVVVPLNPAARDRDLSIWIEHAGARLVIIEQSHAAIRSLEQSLPSCRLLATSDATSTRQLPHRASSGVFQPAADSPAAILFTSGTTGAPKGVLLSHGNLAANTRAVIESLALTPADSVMAVLPFTYAYGASVLLSHLAVGARVVIQRGFGFPQAVVEAMARERVTGFAGVPSTYALLLSRVRLDAFDLSRLRYVTQAGGAMPVPLTRRLIDALPGKQIFVMYGQTEATSRLTCLPAKNLADKLGSVGLPLGGVQIQVRDAAGGARAAGEPGDIWVRGPNVMTGYWRDPEATSQVLRDGWLKTGDMGYVDAEGFLYLVGRRSDIIKVGAHRVHPQDIEDVLAEMDDVSECAVVGMSDEILGEVIKAFIVRPPGSPLQEQQVKRHCLDRLAAYKVPKFVEFVASLPRTSSGKVQRSRLLDPQESCQ